MRRSACRLMCEWMEYAILLCHLIKGFIITYLMLCQSIQNVRLHGCTPRNLDCIGDHHHNHELQI